MKTLRLGLLFSLFLAACGQQGMLELQKDQFFSKQFSSDNLILAQDDGRAVTLKPMEVKQASGATRGFVSQPYYGGCTSIYGCQQDPYSSWLGYSNYAHSWNPAITRTVNMNFGTNTPPVVAAFDPFAAAISGQQNSDFCMNLTITSNKTIDVLRFNVYNPNPRQNSVSGSGTSTVRLVVRNRNIGSVILAVRDQQELYQACPQQYQQGWNPGNWWDYSQYYYPNCSAPSSSQATLYMTGTAGPCSAPQQVSLNLSSQLNSQSSSYDYWNQGSYNMPYFNHPAGIWGRVLQYSGQNNINFWGM
jgi:hypothetical protein